MLSSLSLSSLVIISSFLPLGVLAARGDDDNSGEHHDAEDPQTFTWGFENQGSTISALHQCQAIHPTVYSDGAPDSGGSHPPYTMFAYPTSGGIPTQQTLGSGSSLSWTVPYPGGTQIIMAIYDSQGNDGGWLPIYFVQSTSDSSCLISSSESPVKLTLNSTSIDKCDPLGISISGGQKPYTINIVPAGTSADALNYTLPSSDSYYNWFANVSTGNHMLVGVRDSTGTFAASPPVVTITGSNSATCSGSFAQASAPAGATSSVVTAKPSGSATAAGSRGSNSSSSSSGHKKSNTGAIVGGIIGGIVGAILILWALWFMIRRNRRRERAEVAPSTTIMANGDSKKSDSNKGSARLSKQKLAEKPAVGRVSTDGDPPPPPMPMGGKGKEADLEKGGGTGVPGAERITPFTAGSPTTTAAAIGAGTGATTGAQERQKSPISTEPPQRAATGSPEPITSGGFPLHVANPDPNPSTPGLVSPSGSRARPLPDPPASTAGTNTAPSTRPTTAEGPKSPEVADAASPRERVGSGVGGSLPSGEKSPRPPSPHRPRIVQHEDAGVAPVEEHHEEVEELPPAYGSLPRRPT